MSVETAISPQKSCRLSECVRRWSPTLAPEYNVDAGISGSRPFVQDGPRPSSK